MVLAVVVVGRDDEVIVVSSALQVPPPYDFIGPHNPVETLPVAVVVIRAVVDRAREVDVGAEKSQETPDE
jgi:hypothetical protein